MVYDWLTAALLGPMLARRGSTLRDHAKALGDAVAGTGERHRDAKLGRDVSIAEFATFANPARIRQITLRRGGFDPFASPSEDVRQEAITGLPAMWGGVVRDGDVSHFRPTGILLSPALVLLPSDGGGMALVRHVLPDSVVEVMPGRVLSNLVSHPDIDGLDLLVRRLRPSSPRELVNLDVLGTEVRAGFEQGSSVATFRNDKTSLQIAYDV